MVLTRGSISGSRAGNQDGSRSTVDQIREMIATEVLQILQEELSCIVDRITGKLIAKFEERTETFQTVRKTADMITGGDRDVGT